MTTVLPKWVLAVSAAAALAAGGCGSMPEWMASGAPPGMENGAEAPVLAGTTIDGQPFRLASLRGKWTILVPAGGACDAACGETLYATRQARTMQGKDMDRVARAWLVTDEVLPAPERRAEHPDLVVARLPASEVAKLPQGRNAIVLMDPLGNQVLAWPSRPDPKALAKDLSRLLKASRIG